MYQFLESKKEPPAKKTDRVPSSHYESDIGFVGVGGASIGWTATRFTYRQMFRYASKLDYFLMAVGILFAFISGVLQPLSIYCMGLYVRHALELEYNCTISTSRYSTECRHTVGSKVPPGCLAPHEYFLIGVVVSMIISTTLHPIFMYQACANQVQRIKREYFGSILRKDFAWFDCYIDRDLPHRIHSDIEEIRDGLGEAISGFVAAVCAALALLTYTLQRHTGAAAIVICSSPLIAGVLFYKSRLEQNFVMREQSEYERADELAGEILCNIRTVKQYEGEEKELARYAQALPSVCNMKVIIILLAIFAGLFWVMPAVFLAMVLFIYDHDAYFTTLERYCAYIAKQGEWEILAQPTVMDLILVHICNLFACHELAKSVFLFKRIKIARERARKVFFVIDWKPQIDNLTRRGHKLSNSEESWIGTIEFQGVDFSYPRNPMKVVLRALDFTIEPGQMVALFGKPGSGKSTILNLIMRLYDPTVGEVLLDDKNMRTINPNWLRKQISLVPQETTIFNVTIQDNICLGNFYEKSKIIQVCKAVDIHADIITLPQGYQTPVGSKSDIQFSVNQIAKISLARALLQSSRILLIEGIFADTDEEFQKKFKAILEARRASDQALIVVITASKYNSIVQSCDAIFALKNGEIVDFGSPEDMIARRGAGHRLIEESKEYRGDFKPIFPSQLHAYKFAQAIKRKHDRRDKKEKLGIADEGSKSKPSWRTISQNFSLLTPNFNTAVGYRRFTRPRTTGGFNALAIGNVHGVNLHHFRNVINSTLLRERDMRVKISRLRNFPRRGSHLSSASNNASFEQHEPLEGKASPPAHMAGPASSGSTSSAPVQHRILSDFEDESCSFLSIDFDARIKQYFGWTVNASAGTESISSEDSNAFWNSYSLSLSKALHTKITFPVYDLLSLASFSWPYLVFASLTSALMGLCIIPRGVAITLKFEEHVNASLDQDLLSYVITISAIVAGFIAVIQELVLGFGLCSSVNSMRKSLLRGFLSREMSWFDLPENDIGFLRDSLAADTLFVQIALTGWVTAAAQIFPMIIAFFVAARTQKSWYLAWEDLAIIFVVFAVTAMVSMKDAQYKVDLSLAARRVFQNYSDLVNEAITHARTVILLKLEQSFLDTHERIVALATKKLLVFHTIRCATSALAYTWKVILIAVSFAVASNLAAPTVTNGITTRVFIMMYYVILTMFVPFGTAIASLPTLSKTLAAAAQTVTNIKHWKTVLKLEEAAIDIPAGTPIPELRLHKVSFAFPSAPENKILRDFTLAIPRGKYVAIVGAAKSGKTCIIDLLNGFYNPSSGSLIIDQWNYKSIKTSCLRRLIGFVKQDPLFLDITIGENIAYGDISRHINEEEVIEAAKIANIHHLIERLPKQYNTQMSSLPENPTTFVLRQRLEVARAWIRQPEIVLVDEATVSINPTNDELLESAIKSLRRDRTCVVTSQRIDPIRDADVIVVLQDGIIVEMGTDEELMSRKGLYYEIYVSQQLFEAKYATGGVTFQYSESFDSG